jgi:hypothetical protein
MEDLKEKTGSATIKELLNNALTLLDWAVSASMEGAAICAIDDRREVQRELQMPALCHAAKSAMKAASKPHVQAAVAGSGAS